MIDKSYKQWYEAGNKKPRKGFWWGGSPSDYDTPSPSPSYSGDYEGEAYGTTPAASYSDPSPAPSPSSNDNWDQSPADQPAPAPVDYASLDNEEQQAVDRGEPTAQMTPTERNEQGYGPGGTDNPDYKQKQYEITGDIDELSDFRGIDTRPKVDIADIHGETDDPSSVSYDPTYNPAYQARQTRQAIAESKPAFWDSGLGKVLKVGATIVAPPIATKLGVGEAYRLGKLGYDIKQRKGIAGKTVGYLEKKTGKEFKIPGTDDKPRERDPYTILGEEGGDQRTYAEQLKENQKEKEGDDLSQVVSGKQDVVSKAIAQYTDKDIATMEQAKNLLKATMQAGTYQGRVLTRQQMVILEDKHNELAKLLEAIKKAQAPIEVATGGRVDKVLTGRSRDI